MKRFLILLALPLLCGFKPGSFQSIKEMKLPSNMQIDVDLRGFEKSERFNEFKEERRNRSNRGVRKIYKTYCPDMPSRIESLNPCDDSASSGGKYWTRSSRSYTCDDRRKSCRYTRWYNFKYECGRDWEKIGCIIQL